jgi:VCBS repeat-containing protein
VLVDNGNGVDSDPDGDTLTVTEVNGVPGNVGSQITLASGALLTVNPDGTYDYDPNGQFDALGAGQSDTDSFTYTIDDGNGGTDTATVTITINGTNDAPVIGGVTTGSVTEDDAATLTASGALTISDPDAGQSVFNAGTVNGSYGDLTIDAAGNWSYAADNSQSVIQQLAVGATLTETITVTSADGTPQDITIIINGTNDGPVATDNSGSVTEDTVLSDTGNMLTDNDGAGVDSDIDVGDVLTVASVDGVPAATGSVAGTYGSLTFADDGSYTYNLTNTNPAVQALGAGETLTETFDYVVSDGNGGSDTATLTITINGNNDAPVAQDDAETTDQDTVVSDSVLVDNGNGVDSDPDGDTLTVTEVNGVPGNVGSQITLASGALLTVNPDGTYDYDPNGQFDALGAGQSDTDSFTYTIDDGNGGTDTATVTITINGTNDAPVIGGVTTGSVTEDDAATLTASGALTISDPDAGQSVFNAGTVNGSYGDLTIDAAGNWSYAADNSQSVIQQLAVGATLTETITVTSADGTPQDITIIINGTNDGPVATDNSGSVTEDTVLSDTGNMLTDNDGAGVDSDIDVGDVLTVASVDGVPAATGSVAGTYGSLTFADDGSYTYNLTNTNPAVQALGAGETLTETFDYVVSDGNGGSDTATLTITINGNNDAPVAQDDAETTDQDTVVSDSVLVDNGNGVDSDPDGDTLTVTEVNGVPGNVGSQITLASGALLTVNPDGTYDYDPNGQFDALGAGQSDTDSFTYTIDDGNGGTDTATVTITINGTNDAPVIGGVTTGSVTEDDAATLTASGALTISDPDAGQSVFNAGTVNGSYGDLTIDAAGNWSYAADNSQSVIQQLAVGATLTETITVTSADGTPQDITIIINGTNDGPVATDNSGSVTEDTVLSDTGNMLTDNDGAGVDSDIDVGDVLTVASVDGVPAATGSVAGTYGSLTFADDGSYTYNLTNTNPAVQALGAGETLTETFDYVVSDGNGGSDTATLTITINGNNDAPVAQDDAETTDQDTVVSDSVLVDNGNGVDSDPDGDTLTVTEVNGVPGNVGSQITLASGALLTVNPDGTYDYDPNGQFDALGAGQSDTDSFTYTIDDGNGGTDTATVTITINGTNDAPVIGGVTTGSVTEDDAATLTASGALTISDPDAGQSVFNAGTVNGSYGDLTIDAAGNWSYAADNSQSVIQQLAVGATLTETITVTSADGTPQDITIIINGTNDGPVATDNSGSVTEDTVLSDTGNMLTDNDGAGVDSDIDVGDVLTVASVDGVPAATGSVAGTYGSLTFADDGSYTYNLTNTNPAVQALGAGETLTETFDYVVSDGNGGSDTATLTITINGNNDAPVAQDDAETTDQDTVVSDSVLVDNGNGVDSDPDGDTLTVTEVNGVPGNVGSQITLASGALLTVNPDGTYDYDPNGQFDALGAGQSDTDSFTYTIDDGNGGTDTATVTITINGTNDAPVIGGVTTGSVTEDDAATLTASGALTISDPDAGQSVFNAGTVNGSYGDLTIDAAGNWSYAADNSQSVIQQLAVGATLTETITVTSADGTPQDITIIINGTNDGPVATDNSGSVTEDTVLSDTGNMLTDNDGAGVDSDIDVGDVLTVASVDGVPAATGSVAGTYGSLTFADDGSYTYNLTNTNPAVQALGAGETLTETFDYVVSDGNGGSDTATLTITINGNNDAPVAQDDAETTDQDTVVSDSVLVDNGNGVDSDPDGDTLTVTEVNGVPGNVGSQITLASGALLTVNPDGTYDYDPNGQFDALGAGQSDTDSFTYTIDDGNGGTDTATVTITINGTNDAPVIGGVTTGSVTEDDAATLTASGALTISDPDAGQSVFNAGTVNGSYGDLTIDAAGNWSYAADNSQSVIQQLAVGATLTETITVTSADGTPQDITIIINGTNDGPVATDNSGSVTEDTVLSDTGNMLTDNDGAGVDSDIDVGDVLTVASVDGVPAATGSVAGTYGSLTFADDGSYTYNLTNTNPAVQALGAGETLTETFDYVVSDGNGGSDTATLTITINGNNDAPVAQDDAETTDQDTVVSDSVLVDNGNGVDSDPDGDALTVTEVNGVPGNVGSQITLASGALLTVNPDGTYDYDPNGQFDALGAGQSDTDSFTYTIDDGNGGTDTATVTITINGTNDAPVIGGVTTGSVTEDDAATLTASGALTISDPDAGQSVFNAGTVNGSYGDLTIDAAGNWSYAADNSQSVIQQLAVGATLTETITVTSADGTPQDITIIINGTNDGPVATDNSGSVTEDTVLSDTGNMLTDNDGAGVDSDIDVGDVLTVASVDGVPAATGSVAGTYGSLTFADDGSYTYNLTNTNPAVQALGAGETLTETFDYVVSDGNGGSDTATLTITINGNNDAPTGFELEGPVATYEALASCGVLSEMEVTAGSVLGSLGSILDADVNDTHTFAIVDQFGALAVDADLEIVGNELRVRTDHSMTDGVATVKSIIIRVTDSAGDFVDTTVDLTLNSYTGSFAGGVSREVIVGTDGSDTLDGGDGSDYIFSGVGVDTLNGGNGGDILDGGAGADVLNGGSGKDVASYYSSSVAVTVDLANTALNTGDAVGDIYNSIEGVWGSNFDDQLFGDADGDVLMGGLGDDLIQGRGGNDNLYGGGGNDTFVVNNGDGIDRIFDFEAGAGAGDVLDISAFGFADIASVQAASSIADGYLTIQLDANDAVRFWGVNDFSVFNQDDFLI